MTQERPARPIRILVLPDKYFPDLCGGGAIYTDMCQGLASRGFDVTVRSPYPFYPEWTDKSGRNGWRVDRTIEEGVKVERFGFFIPRNPKSAAQRMMLDATLALSLSRSLFRGRFDAVISFCPHIGGVAFAALKGLTSGLALWLNVQDLPADAASAGGITGAGLLPKVLAWVQKTLFNRADVWSSISPVMMERLAAIRRRQQPILFTPNWLHRSIAEEIHRLPSKVGRAPAEPIRLLYAGNIGTKQGLLDFCKALAGTPTPFAFQIHGDGGRAAEVRDWIGSSGDSRFSFAPILDEPGFVRALHDTDLFVITEKSGSGASFFPSKMAPGMASGSATLAVADPDGPLGREVREQALGPWLPWDRCGEAGALVASIRDRPEEFITWQRNAVNRARFYDREACLDMISRTLVEMIRDRTLAHGRRQFGIEAVTTTSL